MVFKKKVLSLFILLCLVGCATAPAAVEVNSDNAQDTQSESAIATIEPTEAATPTATLPPTETPTTAPSPTPTPKPEPISSTSADNLRMVRRIGNGFLEELTWSHDSKELAVLTSNQLRMIDAEAGELEWTQDTGVVLTDIAFLRAGKKLLSTTSSGVVRTWGTATGKMISDPYDALTYIQSARLSDDGLYMALLVDDQRVVIMDPDEGKIKQIISRDSIPYMVTSLAFSPDHSTLLVAGYNYSYQFLINKWDVKTGEFLGGLNSINRGMDNVQYSPDGKKIGAIARYNIGTDITTYITIWNAENGQKITNFDLAKEATLFAFAPDGESILICYRNGDVERLDLMSGDSLEQTISFDLPITTISFSPNGQKVALGATDGTIEIHDAVSLELLNEFQYDMSLATLGFMDKFYIYYYTELINPGIALSPDGEKVATASPYRRWIDVVDLKTGVIERSFGEVDDVLSEFAFSPDGKTLATVVGERKVILWDFETGDQKLAFNTGHTWEIDKVAFSPDGERLATLCEGEISIWNAETGEKEHVVSGYRTMEFAPEGNILASDNLDFGLYLWDCETGKQNASLSAEYITDLDYSPDGKTIVLSGIQVQKNINEAAPIIYFMDAETHERNPLDISSLPNTPSIVRYSPDGSVVVSGDSNGNIMFWNAKNGTLLNSFDNIAVYPYEIDFTPDGEYMILGSVDGTILHFGTSELPVISAEDLTT